MITTTPTVKALDKTVRDPLDAFSAVLENDPATGKPEQADATKFAIPAINNHPYLSEE